MEDPLASAPVPVDVAADSPLSIENGVLSYGDQTVNMFERTLSIVDGEVHTRFAATLLESYIEPGLAWYDTLEEDGQATARTLALLALGTMALCTLIVLWRLMLSVLGWCFHAHRHDGVDNAEYTIVVRPVAGKPRKRCITVAAPGASLYTVRGLGTNAALDMPIGHLLHQSGGTPIPDSFSGHMYHLVKRTVGGLGSAARRCIWGETKQEKRSKARAKRSPPRAKSAGKDRAA